MTPTALITGGGAGIGAATARRLARDGYRLVIVERSEERAAAIEAELPGSLVRRLDTSDPIALDRALEGIEVDLLVNNTAMLTPVAFHRASDDDLGADLDATLAAPMRLTRRVLPAMLQRRRGTIVNIASVNGIAHYGDEAYSAAKAGLIQFTRSIAVEYGPYGIRCNAVAPGSIRTASWDGRVAADPGVLEAVGRWYPLRRIGEPEDVAEAVAFLASDAARWITGVCLPVDGGLGAGNGRMTRELQTDVDRDPEP